MSKDAASGNRSRAREFLVQALYQMQITGHDSRELRLQFAERKGYDAIDQEYFRAALAAICEHEQALLASVDEIADRPVEQLDPIEKAILMIGFYELESVPEVPYRVVINEAVNLAKRFGAADGHKYINALLDRASNSYRPGERS